MMDFDLGGPIRAYSFVGTRFRAISGRTRASVSRIHVVDPRYSLFV